jgi:TolA-binding protein
MQSKSLLITKFISIVTISTSILSSCATQEDIERRELVSKLKGDMSGQQNITKSLLLKIYNIENNLGIVSGKVETAQHNLELTEQNTIDELKKRVDSIEREHKKYVIDTNAEISKLHSSLKGQKKYLNKLLKELKNISKDTDNENRSLFSQSIQSYQQKKYKNAKNQFLEIINNIESHKLNKRDQALVLHNLAMTFFIESDYKNSQIYFSKLFTQYASSPLNSSGLYHLGMSFKKQKKIKEANEMWSILSTKYPKSRFTKLAKKEIK